MGIKREKGKREAEAAWLSFFRSFILRRPRRRGQAMTEVVLLFPLFMLILFAVVKVFALLVLVQKLEIASFYAARRWQLESHLNSDYAGDDQNQLLPDILGYVKAYIGDDSTPNGAATAKFLGITEIKLTAKPTQVWNIVTLTVVTKQEGDSSFMCKYSASEVCTAPYGAACNDGHKYICGEGRAMVVTKYVPSRDRPVQFELPGLR